MSRSFTILLYLALVFSILLITLLAMQLLGTGIWGIDDAYIFFVYAENFANLDGFVYNVGSERVEGFSSLLWQLMLAAVYLAGLPKPATFAVLSALLSALSLWAVCDLMRKLLQPHIEGSWSARRQVPLPIVLAVAWLIAWPSWFLWNVASFMDVALWTCLLTLTVRELILLVHAPPGEVRSVRRIAALLFLLILTRPESLAWAPFFIVCMAAVLRWKAQPIWPVIRMPCLALITALAGLTAFRLLYFGYPLPNTYYAKVSPDLLYRLADGFAYVGRFFSGGGFASLAVLAAIACFLYHLPRLWSLIRSRQGFSTENSMVLYFLSAYVTATFAIVILEGGDHFGSWRMLQPLYPVLPLFLICLWLNNRAARTGFVVATLSVPRAGVYLLLVTLLLTAPVRGSWFNIHRTKLLMEFEVAEEGIATARVLREIVTAAGESALPMVGVTGAGGFKYEWQGPVLDLMGLNSTAMAHAQGDRRGLNGHTAFSKEVFFDVLPEVVIPHLQGWPGIMRNCKQLQSRRSFYGRVLDRLQVDARFKEQYVFVDTRVGAERICMYVKQSYLQQLNLTAANNPFMVSMQ